MSAQLQQAIINAHNAGDVAAAQRLGQILKQQKQAVPQQTSSPSSVPPHRRNQPKERDGAFAFSVDQAQKMYGGAAELAGRALGSPTIEQYGRNVQAQQDKDIAEGGYQSKYSTFEDSYKKGGLASALGWAAEGVAENAATTGASLLGALGVSAAAVYGAPAWLVAAAGGTTALNNVALNTGENVLEQKEKLGDFDTAYATGAGLLAGALDTVGAGRAIPKDALKTMTVDQIKETLEKQGKGAAAKEFMKRMGVESVTESAQEGISMGTTASLGGEYTPEDVRTRLTDSFLLGGATAGSVNVGIGSAKGAANLVRGNSKNIKDEGDVQAAASFAQRLTTIANANEYDLQDIDKMSTKGARETIDKAHVQYTEELKQKFADLKSRVKITDQDTLAEVADKIMTAAAYREGRNKTKNTVGNQEMAALEKLTGDTREGQEAMSILRQLNQLTQVHNNGYQGGVSQVTDQFAPFGASVGYDKGAVATERLLRPLASGSAAITTGGSSLLAQAAAQGTGRLIDKVTGKRSKVANYIKDNQGRQGIPTSDAPSLRETNIENMAAEEAAAEEARLRQEQMAQEEREASLESAQNNDPANPESPQGIFELGTALDRNGIAQILRIMKRNPSTKPATLRMIEAYETSVATGGQVDFALIRKINGFVDRNPVYKGLMGNRVRNQGAVQQAAQQQLSQKDQNYQRGIENNRAEAARITEAVNADSTIPVQQKAMLLNTLEEMQLDLGLNPVSRLQAMARRLEEQDVPGPTVEKYLGQYLQRVMAQQGAKEERDAAQDDAMEIDESREMSFTDGPALAFDTSPNVNAINEGSETFPKMKGKTEVAKFLEARALNKIGGTVRDIADPADRELIANDLVAEAIYEMNSQDEGSAMDWYDLTIEKMLSMMSLKYPEIATDVNAKTPMLVALSIMSQNMDVPTNLKIAEKAYEYFRDKGQFEVIGQGKSQAVMELNFKKANMLLNKLGSMEALADFLQTKFTVKELNPVLQNYLGDEGKVGGENVDTVVYGSAVFGPKVGNGFYTNLRGDFSPVTMDMWFMRTVGRLKGKLMEFDEKKFQNQLNRLKKALGRKRISKEQLIDKAFELIKLHEADYKKNRKLYDLKKGDPKRKVKSEATKAAFTIKGSLKNTIDSPTNGTERNHLRSLVQTAVTKFNQQTGLSIEPAAFQALIWYPEQDLYKKLGVPLKNVRKDFATSLKELLIKEGFNEQDLNAAIDRVQPRPKLGPREVRQSTVVPEQRTVRNADEQPSRTLQPEEITAEIDLSTQPALLQPDSPQIPFDFTTPTVGQIKDKLEDAKGAVQMVIGKPGTKFEKGLSSMEDFQQLADMLDISIGIFQTHKELRDFSQNNIPIGTEGFFQPNNEGVSGRVAIRNRSNYGRTLLTLAHEMSHGLESRPMDNKPSYTIKRPPAHNLADKKQKQYFDGSLRQSIAQVVAAAQRNYLSDSTFAEKLPDAKIRMNYANDIVSNLTYSQAKSIKDEIDALQNGTFVGFGSAPELGEFPIRLNRKLAKELYFEQNPSATDEEANRRVDEEFLKYEGYIKNDAEFSEDPVLLSIIDPKTSKKLLPTTYKFIQDHFNESNIPVKFFASPLATIVAILMAGMIGGEEEENPGILTPGPGMLSA